MSNADAWRIIGLTQLRSDINFSKYRGSSSQTICIIDHGLFLNNELLSSCEYFIDFTVPSPTLKSADSNRDGKVVRSEADGVDWTTGDGHGTHVMGTVVGDWSGVAPRAKGIAANVFNGTNASLVHITQALQWVLAEHEALKILCVNMSLVFGLYQHADAKDVDNCTTLISQLQEAGITIVGAAGNDYQTHQTQRVGAPGLCSTFLVGSVWPNGLRGYFSLSTSSVEHFPDGLGEETQTVRWKENSTGEDRLLINSNRALVPNMIFAPGSLWSTSLNIDEVVPKEGTSFASPVVSGCVMLLQELAYELLGAHLRPVQLQVLLRNSGDEITDGDDEDYTGVRNTNEIYKRVNIYTACQNLKNSQLGANINPPREGADLLVILNINMPGAWSNIVTLEGFKLNVLSTMDSNPFLCSIYRETTPVWRTLPNLLADDDTTTRGAGVSSQTIFEKASKLEKQLGAGVRQRIQNMTQAEWERVKEQPSRKEVKIVFQIHGDFDFKLKTKTVKPQLIYQINW